MFERAKPVPDEGDMEIVSTDLIRQYLLGDLPAGERVRFEDEYFTDAERFEQLEDAENDLIDDYVRGVLSGPEEEEFRLQYLTSAARKARVDFARTLKDAIHRRKESVSTVTLASRGSIWTLFDGSYEWPRMAFAAAGFAVLVACGTWLLTQNRRLRIELNQAETARAELQRSHDALALQIANLTKPAQGTAPETGQGTEVARVEPPPLPGESLTLTPGMLRAGKQRVPTLVLPLHRSSVQLQLIAAQDGQEHGAYDAAVRTAEEQEPIFTEKHLRLTKSTHGTMVVLHLPSKLIQPGDYSVTLYSSDTDLSGEGVVSYVFRAR
jgi:hypothetical protein